MPETNPPNPSEDPKHPNAGSGDNPTTIIPSIAARPEGLTDEEWALVRSKRSINAGVPEDAGILIDSDGQSDVSDTDTQSLSAQEGASWLSSGKNKATAAVASIALTIVAAGIAIALSGDNHNTAPKAETPTVAPATPGETQAVPVAAGGDAKYWYDNFDKEGLSSVYVTDKQRADLESGNQELVNKALDNTLIPLIDSAEILLGQKYIEGNIDSVDLSSISDDPTVQRFVRQIAEHLNPRDPQWEEVRICQTSRVDDGSSFCLPGLQSTISSSAGGKTVLFGILNTQSSDGGQDLNTQYPYRDSVHFVVGADNRIQLER